MYEKLPSWINFYHNSHRFVGLVPYSFFRKERIGFVVIISDSYSQRYVLYWFNVKIPVMIYYIIFGCLASALIVLILCLYNRYFYYNLFAKRNYQYPDDIAYE